MAFSMYSASVPLFQNTLRNLAHILDRGVASAEARKFDAAVLASDRLAPDMLPFTKQVQIACDAAKLCITRVAGVDAPKFEDAETSFPELKARIQKTLDFLASVPAAKLEGTEGREVTFPVGRDKTRTMTAQDYLTTWALPNFFFHVSMAYAILRHNGVDLGKADYLAGAQR